MVLTAVVSTLMVLFCGSGKDFRDLWNSSDPLNDPTGTRHELDLASLIAEDVNFKSSQVTSWNSLKYDFVRISASSLYGDIWWTTEFNATLMDSQLAFWAVGSNITYSTTSEPSAQLVEFDTENYRIIIRPATVTSFAWFAISVGSLSYGGFPIAFIAKDTSTPFRIPEILDGYLGCWPDSEFSNITFTVSESGASYEICRAHCNTDYSAVAIKASTECYCGNLVENPAGQDNTQCFLNCPGNGTQKCGGFDFNWQSVYHLPGPEMPGATKSETIFSSVYINVVSIIELDISDLEATTGNPAFIEDIIVNATPSTNTYQLFYSTEPCINDTLFQVIEDNITDFPAAGNTTSLELIMVRCLQIEMSAISATVSVELRGPANTDRIEVPVVVIQGIKMVDATTTTTSTITSTTTSTTSTSTTSTSTSTTTTSTKTPETTSTTTVTTTSIPPPQTTSHTPKSPTSTTSTSTTSTATPTVTTTVEETTTATASDTQTSPSAYETTTTPTTSTQCRCNCNDVIPQTNLTAAELQEKIEALKKQLAVNTTELSSYIRAKTSAKDDRPSAVSIGAVGVALLVTVFGSIILIDSSMLVRDFMLLCKNIRGFFAE